MRRCTQSLRPVASTTNYSQSTGRVVAQLVNASNHGLTLPTTTQIRQAGSSSFIHQDLYQGKPLRTEDLETPQKRKELYDGEASNEEFEEFPFPVLEEAAAAEPGNSRDRGQPGLKEKREHIRKHQILVPKKPVLPDPDFETQGLPSFWGVANRASKAAGHGPVGRPLYNYVHEFSIIELSHEAFLKQVTAIESRLIDKFGSTCNLHVAGIRKRREHLYSILRSPFVHKGAQDQYKWMRNNYKLRISFTFELTDASINQWIYSELKHVLSGCATVLNMGYTITRERGTEVPAEVQEVFKRAEALEKESKEEEKFSHVKPRMYGELPRDPDPYGRKDGIMKVKYEQITPDPQAGLKMYKEMHFPLGYDPQYVVNRPEEDLEYATREEIIKNRRNYTIPDIQEVETGLAPHPQLAKSNPANDRL